MFIQEPGVSQLLQVHEACIKAHVTLLHFHTLTVLTLDVYVHGNLTYLN